MGENNCNFYDCELDCCVLFSQWGAMPVLESCVGSDCSKYKERKEDDR